MNPSLIAWLLSVKHDSLYRVIALLPCSDIALEWWGDITTRQKWYTPLHIFFSFSLSSHLNIKTLTLKNFSMLINSYMFLGIYSICTPVYLPLWGFGQNQPSCTDVGLLLNLACSRLFGPYWEATHHPCMSVDFLKYTPLCPWGIFSQIHPSVDIQECISNRIMKIDTSRQTWIEQTNEQTNKRTNGQTKRQTDSSLSRASSQS